MAIHDRDNPPTAVSFASPFASPSFYAAHDAPANRRPPVPAPASVDPRTNGGAGPSAAAGLANERSGGEAGAESLGARTDKHSGAPISEVGQRAAEARGANRDGKGRLKRSTIKASSSGFRFQDGVEEDELVKDMKSLKATSCPSTNGQAPRAGRRNLIAVDAAPDAGSP